MIFEYSVLACSYLSSKSVRFYLEQIRITVFVSGLRFRLHYKVQTKTQAERTGYTSTRGLVEMS